MTFRLFGGFVGGCVLVLCASAAQATDLSGSITGSVSDGSASIPYRLFEPSGLNNGGKKPLVLFLHGMGERGADNVAQTVWMDKLVNHTKSGQHASYVLAPQINTDMWFQGSPNLPTEAMSLTIKALKQVVASENVDPTRVYVTGVSMGAMGTWDILAREPKLFAAAVPMSGGGDTSAASKIKDVPVWAFHGDQDSLVPVSATRDMIDALRAAGGNPNYTEVQGGGHTIWDDAYANDALYDWLFSQQNTFADAAAGTTRSATPSPIASGADLSPAVFTGTVPEPGALAIIALTGALCLARRRRTN
jgi:predicted peptidase